MTLLSPVIEWRGSTTPFSVLSSLAMTGSGFSGAIPVGTNSTIATIRIYNNFANAGSIADATNCVLATYDDTIHQGSAIIVPTTSLYVNVQVLDYNGTTTGQDVGYFSIGGSTKHAIPVNSGTLGGGSPNYITVNIKIAVPGNATQGTVSQGIWLEYNSTA